MTLKDVWLKQLKAGVDFGISDPVAAMLDNFIYLIGDPSTRKCMVVDPAWDMNGIFGAAQAEGYEVVGALVTHWHPDHIGGSMMGHDVTGLAELLGKKQVPIYVNKHEAEWVIRMTGVSKTDLRLVDSGDHVEIGEVSVQCLHTPGHTHGSQCFRCGQALISGDTLFLQGCGRTDLPGGDTETLWETLTTKLLTLPRNLTLYPGHDYGSKPHATMDEVARTNASLRAPTYADFRRMRGG